MLAASLPSGILRGLLTGVPALSVGWIRWFFCLALIPPFVPAWAQDTSSPSEKSSRASDPGSLFLDEVVVTATRSRQKLDRVPSSVSVIKREEIEAAAAENVDDLLRGLAGLDVKRTCGMGSGLPSRLSVRGIPGANRTLLLLDGIPVNAAGTAFMGTNEIPLETLERIEVVRGPFSSLYGSNAFGGVVNNLTKDPAPVWGGALWGALGNWKYQDEGAEVSGTQGPAGLLVSADRRSLGNLFLRDTAIQRTWNPATGAFDVTARPVTNFGYREARGFGKATVDLSRSTRLTLHGEAFQSRLGFGETMYLPAPRDVRAEDHTGLGAAEVASTLSDAWELTVSGYGRRRSERIQNESFDATDPSTHRPLYVYTFTDSRYWEWETQARARFRPSEEHTLTFGAESLLDEGRFDPARLVSDGSALHGAGGASHDLHHLGVYVQEEWTIGRFQVVPGVRFDRSESTDGTFSPKGGVLYHATDTLRFRSSAGLAFRSPTLSELYMPDVSSYGGLIIKANPDLKPEHLSAYDVGVEKDLGGRLTLGVDGFVNDLRDLVANVTSGYDVLYVNVDRARSLGVDSTLTCRAARGLTLSLNHTYQWAVNRLTHRALDYMPRNKGNAVATFSLPAGAWKLQADLRESLSTSRTYGVTDRYGAAHACRLAPYAVTGFGLRATWKARAYVEVKIANLFDARYEETGGYLAPGRSTQWGAGVLF